MLTRTVVDASHWFCPIGSTPAVDLLRDVSISNGAHVDILSLGCGDIRNILFTLWSQGPPRSDASINITACDVDSAILARNVFVLSYLVKHQDTASPLSDQSLDALWSVYYHFFITSEALKILQDHALELAEASSSLENWRSSLYGSAFSFMSTTTLTEVSRLWRRYADTSLADDEETRKAISEIVASHNRDTIPVTGFRSAGVHGSKSFRVISECFPRYWMTGVVAGNSKDCEELAIEHGGSINPLLALSSAPIDRFSVHPCSDPLLGFHLTSTFDTKDPDTETLAQVAKAQFRSWCRSFTQYVDAQAIIIQLHHGDALNFCYKLQKTPFYPAASTYVRPWSAQSLVLEATVCHSYDVIDMSDLLDHVGLLNLLPAAVPLLNRQPQSVMYTESLLLAAEDPSQSLQALLNADITTLSLILNVAPIGHLVGITDHCSGHEGYMFWNIIQNKGRQKQYRMRIPWRPAYTGDVQATRILEEKPRLAMDPLELASFLMDMYLAIFGPVENLSMHIKQTMRMRETPLSGDMRWYSRLTIVALLGLMRQTISTDWKTCINSLLKQIVSDQSMLMGSNHLEELYLHLHISQLRIDDTLMTDPRGLQTSFGLTRSGFGEIGLLRHMHVPTIVHVVLVVPRSALRIITDESHDEIETPPLYLSVYNEGRFSHNFFAIDAFFGSLENTPGSEDFHVVEDVNGWGGLSSLIVTCIVPTFLFLVGERNSTRVALAIEASPSTVPLVQDLGDNLHVFDAGLEQTEHLILLSKAPTALVDQQKSVAVPGDMLEVNLAPTVDSHPEQALLSLKSPGKSETPKITVRCDYTDPVQRQELLAKATVKVVQSSPCTVTITLNDRHPRTIAFPYPIDRTRCKAGIARKQSWIEIIISPSSAMDKYGYNLDPMAIVSGNTTDLSPWSIGRMNIQRQPIISDRTDASFLKSHFGMCLSLSEMQAHKSDGIFSVPEALPGLLAMKNTLLSIFLSYAGLYPGRVKKSEFCILADETGDPDTIIIMNGLHHDTGSGSVILDCFVIPLNVSRVQTLVTTVPELLVGSSAGVLHTIKFEPEAERLWKSSIPALVERSRFSWEHMTDCAYLTAEARIPLSVAHREVPICDCGHGKDSHLLPKKFQPAAQFATRIALSPLCAIPYVERLATSEPQNAVVQPSSDVTAVESASTTEIPACANCGSTKAGLKNCQRCDKVKYCNHACVKADWKKHKKSCGK